MGWFESMSIPKELVKKASDRYWKMKKEKDDNK